MAVVFAAMVSAGCAHIGVPGGEARPREFNDFVTFEISHSGNDEVVDIAAGEPVGVTVVFSDRDAERQGIPGRLTMLSGGPRHWPEVSVKMKSYFIETLDHGGFVDFACFEDPIVFVDDRTGETLLEVPDVCPESDTEKFFFSVSGLFDPSVAPGWKYFSTTGEVTGGNW